MAIDGCEEDFQSLPERCSGVTTPICILVKVSKVFVSSSIVKVCYPSRMWCFVCRVIRTSRPSSIPEQTSGAIGALWSERNNMSVFWSCKAVEQLLPHVALSEWLKIRPISTMSLLRPTPILCPFGHSSARKSCFDTGQGLSPQNNRSGENSRGLQEPEILAGRRTGAFEAVEIVRWIHGE